MPAANKMFRIVFASVANRNLVVPQSGAAAKAPTSAKAWFRSPPEFTTSLLLTATLARA
jgi:hypothetical protein